MVLNQDFQDKTYPILTNGDAPFVDSAPGMARFLAVIMAPFAAYEADPATTSHVVLGAVANLCAILIKKDVAFVYSVMGITNYRNAGPGDVCDLHIEQVFAPVGIMSLVARKHAAICLAGSIIERLLSHKAKVRAGEQISPETASNNWALSLGGFDVSHINPEFLRRLSRYYGGHGLWSGPWFGSLEPRALEALITHLQDYAKEQPGGVEGKVLRELVKRFVDMRAGWFALIMSVHPRLMVPTVLASDLFSSELEQFNQLVNSLNERERESFGLLTSKDLASINNFPNLINLAVEMKKDDKHTLGRYEAVGNKGVTQSKPVVSKWWITNKSLCIMKPAEIAKMNIPANLKFRRNYYARQKE
jgi:hypothetical protein